MTATEVNGIEVVKAEPAETDRSTPEEPRYYKQIHQLTLADESTLYGCAVPECTFTASAPNGVRPHLGIHNRKPKTAAADVKPVLDLDVRLAELVGAHQRAAALQSALDRLHAENEDLKAKLQATQNEHALTRRKLARVHSAVSRAV